MSSLLSFRLPPSLRPPPLVSRRSEPETHLQRKPTAGAGARKTCRRERRVAARRHQRGAALRRQSTARAHPLTGACETGALPSARRRSGAAGRPAGSAALQNKRRASDTAYHPERPGHVTFTGAIPNRPPARRPSPGTDNN